MTRIRAWLRQFWATTLTGAGVYMDAAGSPAPAPQHQPGKTDDDGWSDGNVSAWMSGMGL